MKDFCFSNTYNLCLIKLNFQLSNYEVFCIKLYLINKNSDPITEVQYEFLSKVEAIYKHCLNVKGL